MAYKVSMLPISEGSDVIGQVMFPVYVKMRGDIQRLKRAYFRSVLLIAGVAIPLGGLFLLFPDLIIRIILGDQWLAASSVLQVLALFGVMRAISISCIAPLYALEKQEYVTVITLISLGGMLATVFPFIEWWGLVGAGYAALAGTIIAFPVIFYAINKVFQEEARVNETLLTRTKTE